MNKKESADGGKPRREPGLLISLVPIVTVFVLLLLSLTIFHLDIHIPLIFAAIVAATISVLVLHNRWEDVEKGIITSIMNAMQAILIACIIGLIIALPLTTLILSYYRQFIALDERRQERLKRRKHRQSKNEEAAQALAPAPAAAAPEAMEATEGTENSTGNAKKV